MSRLPQPPAPAVLQANLRRAEDVVAVHRATRLVRIFTAKGLHPQRWNSFRHTGPLPHARFDTQPPSPDGAPTHAQDQGVLYFGLSVRTSVAEVFQATSVVDRRTRSPFLVVLRPRRTLRLLDLTGLWPTRVGASQEISTGPKHLTQQWARAIRAAYPELDGLWYRSSMDAAAPAVCLWNPPAGSGLPPAPDVLLPLEHPGLDLPLSRICEELNYTLLG
ncbi:RES family NAD+ phosphorylase [Saccharothrix australiensis]|uniref:RES domain-containing protein n=1 Tax=Saccharothrix australiensis TaxID=2072 RepID=A0A495W5W4_9PSEU|nr:RES family NAD+ phosphorylase [Saccharothrix australiensis]RKT56674.1 RES domain-containing protein [Saccharothrix australiensis]